MPFVLRITDHWNRSACQVRGARKRSDSIQHAIQPIIGSAQRNWQSQPCQGRKTGRARGHRDEEAFQPRATTGGPLASTRVSTVHPFEGTRKARSQAWQETFRHHEEKQRRSVRAPIQQQHQTAASPNKGGIAGQDAPRGKTQRLVHASRRQRFRQRRPL